MEEINIKEIGNYLHDRLLRIRELSEKVRIYFTNTTSVEDILYWLLQFGTLENIKIAYTLLENLDFISEKRLVHLVKKAIEKANRPIEKSIFCPVGNSIDSGTHISYPLSKAFGLSEEELSKKFISYSAIEKKISEYNELETLIFFDDNIASGIQLFKFFTELFIGKEQEKEFIDQPVSEALKKRILELDIIYCVGVRLSTTTDVEEKIIKEFKFKSFKIFYGLSEQKNYLDFASGVWENEQETEQASILVKNISRELYKQKNWPKHKLNDRLLGYGNMGKLTLFSYNTPKSLLPIFWKFGYYNKKPWFPLFPERGEWTQNEKNILVFDQFVLHFAKQLCAGSFGERSPILSVAFRLEFGDSKKIEYSAPDAEIQKLLYEEIIKNHLPLSSKKPNMPVGKFETGLGAISTSFFDFEGYNSAVQKYNQERKVYEKNLKKAIFETSHLFSLPIRINNQGISPATEVILHLHLPDGVSFVSEPSELIPDAPQKPQEDKFNKFSSHLSISDWNQNSEISALRQRNRNLLLQEKMGYELSYQNGKPLIKIFFSKIIHQTFKDDELQYFYLTSQAKTISFEYTLICEEFEKPLEGNLKVDFKPKKNLTKIMCDLFEFV